MAATKPNCHARSNSFPSRIHPLISQFDEQLCRSRASEAPSSSTSISQKLNGLQDLYDCVDELLLLPLTQQALAQEQNEKCIDELLDGSLRLLEVCSNAKDTLLQTKETTLELGSIIRRRRGGKSELASDVKKFLATRKVMKKAISKALGNLKGVSPFSKEHEAAAMVSMLKEVEAVTQTVLGSMLSFISGLKTESKPSEWSLVSNLMHQKRVVAYKDEETNANEFVKVDAALHSFVGHKTKESDNIIGNAQNLLQNLELCIQDLEESLEHLSRRLIKTRVSLLNILNH